MKAFLCKECNEVSANSNNVLARHVRSIHNLEWSEYVVKHELDGKWPTCECGCGNVLPWRKGGFQRFVKGHDNKGEQNPMAVKKASKESAIKTIQEYDDIGAGNGWFPNPWTGQEEYIGFDIEKDFFLLCISNDDPVTRDHGLKIGWEDLAGKTHIYTPTFMHLKKKLIFDLGGFSDVDGSCRLSAIRDWCNQHKMMMLSLVFSGDGKSLNVIEWFKAKES